MVCLTFMREPFAGQPAQCGKGGFCTSGIQNPGDEVSGKALVIDPDRDIEPHFNFTACCLKRRFVQEELAVHPSRIFRRGDFPHRLRETVRRTERDLLLGEEERTVHLRSDGADFYPPPDHRDLQRFSARAQIELCPYDTNLRIGRGNNERSFTLPDAEICFPCKREAARLARARFRDHSLGHVAEDHL